MVILSAKTGGPAIPEIIIFFSAETPEPSLATTFTITSPFEIAVNKPVSETCAIEVSKTFQVTALLFALLGKTPTVS